MDKLNRREFLALAGATGIGLGIAACTTPAAPIAQSTPVATPSGPDDIDAMHEKGVKDFVANLEKNTANFFPKRLPFKLDGATKVFEITCEELEWETAPGQKIAALTYNRVVPGPEIRVTEGDTVRVIVTNKMKESTAIHWHGVHTPNKMDGVPYVTQPPIKPGETFTYEFSAKPIGSHMYHSHHNAAEQVTKGLLGAFIVEPKDKKSEPAFDSEYVLILNDSRIGLTLNGKSFPATGAIIAKRGEKVRVRFMNEGLLDHPMHFHGGYMQIVAQDGWVLPNPTMCDTVNIAPGQRFDAIIQMDEPGVWAFHCHILTHAESPHGMFGMVTALIVQ
ncbi:MAG: multicopper oxidase domain-containing protein [Chloroflexi bacterium]|nr:multicopper oxidase domain-containing protein [Chloroflexota bacterium]